MATKPINKLHATKRLWVEQADNKFKYLLPDSWVSAEVTILRRPDIVITERGRGFIWVTNPKPNKKITLLHTHPDDIS